MRSLPLTDLANRASTRKVEVLHNIQERTSIAEQLRSGLESLLDDVGATHAGEPGAAGLNLVAVGTEYMLRETPHCWCNTEFLRG